MPIVRRSVLRSASNCCQPLLARVEHPVGDHVHRRVEVELLPLGGVRRAVAHLGQALRPGDQLLARRTLGAQAASRDRAVRVALDLDDLAVFDVHLLRAPDRAERADRVRDVVGFGGARASA